MASRGQESFATPSVLIWARESAGYSVEDAAKRIQIKPAKLLATEAGESRITVRQLRALSEFYKRPLAFFYLPSPPEKEQELHDFRRHHETQVKPLSPNLKLEIRKARFRREKAIEIYDELDAVPERFTLRASTTEDVKAIAERIRNFLGVTIEQQTAFKNEYSALNTWRDVVESRGVLVFQASLKKSEIRGFSIWENPLPIILLNTKETVYSRIFTLLHEIAHLTLRAAGLCDLSDTDKIEVLCNSIAGEALVPEESLLSEEAVTGNNSQTAWPERSLAALSSRFSVSREVVLRRLLTLKRTTPAFYQSKRAEWKKEFEARQPKSEKVIIPQPVKIVSHHGKAYTRLVLNGYYSEAINAIDVSEYLGGVKLKYLPKIEEVAFKNSAYQE